MDALPPSPAAERRPRDAAAAGEALLAWYDRHQRSLPWRAPAGAADPYRVWLSEVMLQQTTVAAVIPYFERFLARWPTVKALAGADEGEVMGAWAGLGYYARARNLIACARAVAAAGGFPGTAEGLRTLPGVGVYTSAAIAAIAFGERVVVVDGNVERVVSRLVALDVPPKRATRTVAAVVEAMLTPNRPGDFAQGMMDLGATICTPKRPACAICPLRPHCTAAGHNPLDYPVKAPKKAKRLWSGTVFVPWRADGTTLLRRRPPKGLLGGMLEPFGSPWDADEGPDLSHSPFEADWTLCGVAQHGFTHADLTLHVYSAQVKGKAPTPAGGLWLAPADAGLPTVFKKAVARALPDAPE